jgi:DNA repair protein RAD5
MESPHPDERPHKKRRFFAEDSSPVQIRKKQPSPHPQTPPPAVDSNEQPQAEVNGQDDARDMDGFDVGMLQAVVGELSAPTLQKLKDVSGNSVERGRRVRYETEGSID